MSRLIIFLVVVLFCVGCKNPNEVKYPAKKPQFLIDTFYINETFEYSLIPFDFDKVIFDQNRNHLSLSSKDSTCTLILKDTIALVVQDSVNKVGFKNNYFTYYGGFIRLNNHNLISRIVFYFDGDFDACEVMYLKEYEYDSLGRLTDHIHCGGELDFDMTKYHFEYPDDKAFWTTRKVYTWSKWMADDTVFDLCKMQEQNIPMPYLKDEEWRRLKPTTEIRQLDTILVPRE